MESCCIYICSVGPIEDCCVMLLLRFPPARKCLVGTFESFLCGFGGIAKTCIGLVLRALQRPPIQDKPAQQSPHCRLAPGDRNDPRSDLQIRPGGQPPLTISVAISVLL